MRSWITPRLHVLRSIALGIVTWPVALAAAWALVPQVHATDRVAFAFQLAAVPALVLFAMVSSLMRLFDKAGAEDPFAGAESQRFKVNCRVMQNTLEQAAIFAPILVALALQVPPDQLRWTVILLSVWTTGRLLFWVGYHLPGDWRGPGMDWTLFTAATAAGWLVLRWF